MSVSIYRFEVALLQLGVTLDKFKSMLIPEYNIRYEVRTLNYLLENHSYVSSVIDHGFVWMQTPEGNDYWMSISDAIDVLYNAVVIPKPTWS